MDECELTRRYWRNLVPEVDSQIILISASQAAKFFGLNEEQWQSHCQAGDVGPAPRWLGKTPLWDLIELRRWAAFADRVTGRLANYEVWQDRIRLLERHVSWLTLSPRIVNALRDGKVATVGDLIECSESDLARMRRLGDERGRSIREIRAALAEHGLELSATDRKLRTHH